MLIIFGFIPQYGSSNNKRRGLNSQASNIDWGLTIDAG